MFYVAIPSRYSSTRLPGKPLCLINGKPMVERVCEQTLKSFASQVIVCIDDFRVEKVLNKHPVTICYTSKNARSGTERIAEMIKKLNIDPETIIVNVQGDEPLIESAHINSVAELLENTSADMATLCARISDIKDVFDYLDGRFVQCHRSCIVNKNRVEELNYKEGYFVLDTGEKVYMLSKMNKKMMEVE